MSDQHVESRTHRLDRALRELLTQTTEVEAAAVVSFDGLPMASALPPSMDEDRVAAMSAALLSLGERAAQGLGRGELSQVYIEGDNGTVFLVSCEDEAVLVAVAAKGAKAGMMLYEVKRAARTVADALRVEEAPPAPAAEPLLSVVAGVAAVSAVADGASVPQYELPTYELPTYEQTSQDAASGWSSNYLPSGSAEPAPASTSSSWS